MTQDRLDSLTHTQSEKGDRQCTQRHWRTISGCEESGDTLPEQRGTLLCNTIALTSQTYTEEYKG